MPPTDQLEPDKIAANLDTALIGRNVIVLNATSSTNDIAAEYARDRYNDGLVIFAEEQTAGRGRASNKWLTGRSDSILCSVLLTRCTLSSELLCLAAAVAVAEAIGPTARIKWPNDIFLNGKKVAGILLESKPSDCGSAYIIGIGINCHQQRRSFGRDLQGTATSIDIETETTCNRISLSKRLLTTLDHYLKVAQDNCDQITDHWRELSIQLGHRITLIFDGAEFTGNCIGIDPQEGLILQLESGGVRMFHAAQTTVAK